MMKHIFFISIILFSITAEAQYNSQYNRRQSMQPRQPRAAQQPRAPKIDVEKAVGLTFYNIEKVAKKIGVKKSSKTFDKIASIFNSFNRELKQVKRINTFLFSEGKSKMEAAQKEAMKNRDFSALQKANKEVTESFKPIIKVIEEKEEKLDTDIEKVLTDKQQKKWVKYKTNLKKK
ncbi:MAG: hypothetical protein QMC07_04395 [Flavobacteriaceae bacterium]|jgi:transcription termination factor NusB|nr:hypothetical protein [Flavobacteriaceae bacterium]